MSPGESGVLVDHSCRDSLYNVVPSAPSKLLELFVYSQILLHESLSGFWALPVPVYPLYI